MTRKIEQQVFRVIKLWRIQRVQQTEGQEDIISNELSKELEELNYQMRLEDDRKLEAARARGKVNGRPPIINTLPTPEYIRKRLKGSTSQKKLARELGVSVPTLMKRSRQG